MWMTWVDLIEDTLIGCILDTEILILGIVHIISNNLIDTSRTLNECEIENRLNGRSDHCWCDSILLWTERMRYTRDDTSVGINTHSIRKWRLNRTITVSILNRTNRDLFIILVEWVFCFRILNTTHRTITNKELKFWKFSIISIRWMNSESKKRISVRKRNKIKLFPFIPCVTNIEWRENHVPRVISWYRSFNREWRRRTTKIIIRPYSIRIDEWNRRTREIKHHWTWNTFWIHRPIIIPINSTTRIIEVSRRGSNRIRINEAIVGWVHSSQ